MANDNLLASGQSVPLKKNAYVTMVNELITPDHEWDINLITSNLSSARANEVLKTPISWTSPLDKLFWPNSTNGSYSVKSGYNIIMELSHMPCTGPSSSTGLPFEIWNWIWGSNVPENIKHFIWKVCHNALPTKEALHKKRFALSLSVKFVRPPLN